MSELQLPASLLEELTSGQGGQQEVPHEWEEKIPEEDELKKRLREKFKNI